MLSILELYQLHVPGYILYHVCAINIHTYIMYIHYLIIGLCHWKLVGVYGVTFSVTQTSYFRQTAHSHNYDCKTEYIVRVTVKPARSHVLIKGTPFY